MASLKTVNLKIDSKLWQSAKIEALRQGKLLMVFVDEALREKINRKKA